MKRKKEELEANSGAQLKEICAAKRLSIGASKEHRIECLLRAAREGGEIEHAIFLVDRAARRKVLESMDKAALLQLCQELGVDPFVKAVLVERLLDWEAEASHFAAVPSAKMPRGGQLGSEAMTVRSNGARFPRPGKGPCVV